MVGEAVQFSQFEQEVMEELRAQRVYTTLASSPPVVALSSHISGDEERPNYIVGTEVGGMVNALSFNSS